MRLSLRNTLLLLAVTLAASARGAEIAMDAATADSVAHIISTRVQPSAGEPHGTILGRVSAAFLGTRYRASTLIGGPRTPEVLVADFRGVDCFTYVDYVEALSRSRDRESFLQNLARIRYVNGRIAYLNRRHFFSDWFATAPRNGVDITPQLSPRYLTVRKQLNLRPDGGEYVRGLGIRPRSINYIPGRAVDAALAEKIREGDYVGIYSPQTGLDVTHVGIAVRHDGELWFRDASSIAAERKVVDSPFLAYVRQKPGIVVIRTE